MNYKNKDWLIDQYISQRKSARKIAEECKVDHQTIVHYLNVYEIYRPLPTEKHPKRW
jgi:hypothetical protein